MAKNYLVCNVYSRVVVVSHARNLPADCNRNSLRTVYAKSKAQAQSLYKRGLGTGTGTSSLLPRERKRLGLEGFRRRLDGMTKKDFIAAAGILRGIPSSCRSDAVDAFARLFKADNPRFDTVRFKAAVEG